MYKFEKLRVWQAALEYIDLIYEISEQLPRSEQYNLRSQIQRAATSVALNIAEGSTGQTNAEQAFQAAAIHKEVAPHLSPYLNLGPYGPGTTEWVGYADYETFTCENLTGTTRFRPSTSTGSGRRRTSG